MKFSKERQIQFIDFIVGLVFTWVAWAIFIGSALWCYYCPDIKGILAAVQFCICAVSGIASAIGLVASFISLGELLKKIWAEQ